MLRTNDVVVICLDWPASVFLVLCLLQKSNFCDSGTGILLARCPFPHTTSDVKSKTLIPVGKSHLLTSFFSIYHQTLRVAAFMLDLQCQRPAYSK